jgi:hypothetical protein
MTAEEYFEEWWTPKELPQTGFNKTAMLDFAEMYHKQALRIHDVVGCSEQLCQCTDSHEFNETYEKEFCRKCDRLI